MHGHVRSENTGSSEKVLERKKGRLQMGWKDMGEEGNDWG